MKLEEANLQKLKVHFKFSKTLDNFAEGYVLAKFSNCLLFFFLRLTFGNS